MMTLTELVNTLSDGYLTAQALTIFMLFAVGFLFVRAVWDGEAVWEILLAFPAGLSLFAVTAYLMLCLGIPYNTYTEAAALALISISCTVLGRRKRRIVDINEDKRRNIIVLISIIGAFGLCFMLTANVFDVVLDNDSFFYFSAYPEAIVREGAYIRFFDVFLTDAAPIGSIIQTLPYLFGFSETFGIQYFLDVNFMLIFFGAFYTELPGSYGKKEAAFCAAGVTLFLLTSSAYLTTAKWVMAGVYFMSYFFIGVYLAYRVSSMEKKPYVLLALFAVTAAMMRHEGVVFILIAVLTLSVFTAYSGKELVLAFICPVTVAAVIYYIRVFFILDVHPLYAFLTVTKAAVMVAGLIITGFYLLMVKERITGRMQRLLPILLPVILFVMNIVLLAVRPSEYLGNLKMFYLNVRIGAGWGYFGYVGGVLLLILIIKAVVNREWYLSFFDSLMISFVLGVLLAAFGRGDALRKGVGDSGNRVMLTAVPVIVFAVALRFIAKKEPDSAAADGEKDRDASKEAEDDSKG